MCQEKISGITKPSRLTVESSEDVAIVPTSDAHLKYKFILKHEDLVISKGFTEIFVRLD